MLNGKWMLIMYICMYECWNSNQGKCYQSSKKGGECKCRFSIMPKLKSEDKAKASRYVSEDKAKLKLNVKGASLFLICMIWPKER